LAITAANSSWLTLPLGAETLIVTPPVQHLYRLARR
jgi:hypothetical protein